jgi:hypothetical protein
MRRYFLAHWRGEQGLLRSCLLNGCVLNYGMTFGLILLFMLSAGAASSVGKAPVVWAMACAEVVAMWSWTIWASVGIVRCGIKNARNPTNKTAQRVGGVVAIIWALCIVVFMFTGWPDAGLFRVAACHLPPTDPPNAASWANCNR